MLVTPSHGVLRLVVTRVGAAPSPLPVSLLLSSLPPPPPALLDAYLDTAERCFVRYGVGRTSLPDIARDLGVSRTTVYRRAGSIERLASLLISRELHTLLASLPEVLEGAEGPRTLTRLLARVVRFCRDHPVIVKVLEDEPELIGTFLRRQLPSIIEQVRLAAEPLLTAAMERQLIHHCEPGPLAELLVRQVVSCIIVPPSSEIELFLDQILVPLLEP
ncbi:MAG: TetR/AcrR family transcriptional regulator [Acidimicrobiales bacterium]|nr:TetR/AcrR family transcriptional regulator [Acidimicrobiales bacterium]